MTFLRSLFPERSIPNHWFNAYDDVAMTMIATRTIWRYTKNTLVWPETDSTLETIQKGDRCDWTAGTVYEQLGWATRVCAYLEKK